MIPIFKQEEDAGLSDLIRSSASITYASKIYVDVHKDEDKLQKILESSATANPDQFDLFYLESVLASVGWNANDDVFDPYEIWNARNTPIDKQFNFMHDETDIIGHLTSSKIVSNDGKLITSKEDLPTEFDIVVGSVLYRTWSDAQLQERMNTIIEEIRDGKWCVSMECLFRHFDYAVITSTGENKIVPRTEDSSFLTKHLRVYGGSGEFDGSKLGRLLRGFSFSGKGLVDNPANPRSKITIFNDKQEMSSFADIFTIPKEPENEEKSMPISQEQYDALKAQNDSLKVDLEKLQASKTAEAKEELDKTKAEIVSLEKTIADLNKDIEANKEIVSAKDESIKAFEEKIEELKSELSEANDKLVKQEKEAVKATRKALLLEKVDEDRASALVEKFESASDEMFEALVESLPAKKMEEKDEDEDKKDKKYKEDKEDKAKSETEDNVDTDLDDAKADDADMVSGDDAPADLRAAASSWFSESVLQSTAKKQ